MIKVFGDYYITIETNPLNYVARKGKGKRGKKNQWIDKPLGYYRDMSGTLSSIREHIIADELSEACTPLDQALTTISRLNDEFEKAIRGITG